ncbi:MAG: hypothetical protein QM731_18040 [Chitinophagaceae bacterium]
MNILVFKTNLRYKKHILSIVPYLAQMKEIIRWNVDLHDRDKILRIESNSLSPRRIEETLTTAGYYCKELED